ncbi:MAG: hypothetical protein L6R39_004389 [Caloplaca ligustica]|nr:MAG: hypothetical protein L6R39_004389 [Caloplaca ligustica]
MFVSRKRAREDDESEWEPQLQHPKRPRALPFRNSPTTKHNNTLSQSPSTLPKPLLTPALTPTETSEDEGELKNPFRSPIREKSTQLTLNSVITIEDPRDFDMDIDTVQPTQSPQPWGSVESSQPSPCTIVPRTLSYNPQEVNNGGRIPTPIYGHFNHVDRNMDMEIPEESNPQTQQEIAHDLFLRRRRLPSPISEDEAMDAPDGMGGMLGRLDMGSTNTSQSPFKTNKMWGGGATKGKMTISMGYRADCDKCRMRVPGHYNHLIRA